ncbi:MAG: PQQ-dependent sugar dehydrogenase, partial [Rhodothermia bacterium]|nr:PQQ-dependent sugar dehydrogenase [Rhodothermia bacterium]
AWYTGGGHTAESYDEPLYRDHLLGGINYATGAAPGDCQATIESSYRIEVIDESPSNPMGVAAAPDGRVFIIERTGRIRLFDPSAGSLTTAGQLTVFSGFEDGLLGIVLDPDFDTNGWLYLFYSPALTAEQRVSRFQLDGNLIDLSTEKILLTIPVQREQCCHSAGDLEFGPDGNLYISTGDNTNPFESDGYAPIDERAGRGPWDAQKSSSNVADLRGKILRIKPEPDGTYSVPTGNLFPTEGSAGRPEIYAMGLRNPFRISIDPVTSWVYWGDVGPDASEDSFLRGSRGYDEWNQARAAGNFGWPYCIANNKTYRDYDFATTASGRSFVCLMPTNDSPNNTGSSALPPAQPAWIWYPYGPSVEFPEITPGPGRTAMAGPVYQFDSQCPPGAIPSYFDGALFIYDWRRAWIKEVQLNDDGEVLAINDFLPSTTFKRPIDMHVGPDGSLYVVEWGDGFGGNNPDARVNRITYQPDGGTGVGVDLPTVPGEVVVHPIYPNPLRDRGSVIITISRPARIDFTVYDALGREAFRIARGTFSSGRHEFELKSDDLASGTYLLRLTGLGKPIVRPFAVAR